MTNAGNITVILFTASLTLFAQAPLSSSAYRVLGQPDFVSNAFNQPKGNEVANPIGIALDSQNGVVRLYVADTANNRVLGWPDANAAQAGNVADVVLGQPDLYTTGAISIGGPTLNGPTSVAVQPGTGNVFVADFGKNRVLRFKKPFDNPGQYAPDVVYGQTDFNGRSANAGGLSASSLRSPRTVAFDADKNLWVSDSDNNRVLRYPANQLDANHPAADLVLGQSDFTTGAANAGGIAAGTMSSPAGLAFDSKGNLYVVDSGNNRVLVFTPPFTKGMAATGLIGQTRFNSRAIAPASSSTMAAPQGVAVASDGSIYVAVAAENRVLVFDPPVAAAPLMGPAAKAVIGQTDYTSTSANAGSAPVASVVSLSAPADVKIGTDNRVYIADSGNNRITSYVLGSKSASGVTGQPNFAANSVNQVKAAAFSAPFKAVIDYSQSPYPLYISDTANNRVLIWRDAIRYRNGSPADQVIGQPNLESGVPNYGSFKTDATTAGSLLQPRGLAVDSLGNLYVADSGNNRVLRYPRPVSQSGAIVPDAVWGQPDFLTNRATAAVSQLSLLQPRGVTIAPNGHLIVADTGNNRVLEYITDNPTAVRVFGQSNFTTGIRAATASAQSLSSPQGVFVDGLSNLYVADSGDNRVVVFSNISTAPATGAAASTVVGQGTLVDSQAGSGASRLNSPADVFVISDGSLFVSDTGNSRVLMFPSFAFLPAAGGAATFVFGQQNLQTSLANWNNRTGLGTPEALFFPMGIFFDRQSTMYVADTGNNRVLQVLRPVSVVNGASFVASAPVCVGAWVTLFGTSLADDAVLAGEVPYPKVLRNRSILINDEVFAPLYYVSGPQFNFQMPSGVPQGQNRIAVRVADTEELMAGGMVSVAAVSPAVFLSCMDNGAARPCVTNADGLLNTPTNPAPKGSYITIYGTGQGEVNPAVNDGEPAPSSEPLARTVATPTTDGVTCVTSAGALCVAMGSKFADIQFSGLAPGFVGLWQLNVKIPEDTATGSVPVRVVIHSVPSNTITVSVK